MPGLSSNRYVNRPHSSGHFNTLTRVDCIEPTPDELRRHQLRRAAALMGVTLVEHEPVAAPEVKFVRRSVSSGDFAATRETLKRQTRRFEKVFRVSTREGRRALYHAMGFRPKGEVSSPIFA